MHAIHSSAPTQGLLPQTNIDQEFKEYHKVQNWLRKHFTSAASYKAWSTEKTLNIRNKINGLRVLQKELIEHLKSQQACFPISAEKMTNLLSVLTKQFPSYTRPFLQALVKTFSIIPHINLSQPIYQVASYKKLRQLETNMTSNQHRYDVLAKLSTTEKTIEDMVSIILTYKQECNKKTKSTRQEKEKISSERIRTPACVRAQIVDRQNNRIEHIKTQSVLTGFYLEPLSKTNGKKDHVARSKVCLIRGMRFGLLEKNNPPQSILK